MENEVKIICTVGPTSLNEEVLRRIELRPVSLVRINLSHVREDDIETMIEFLRKFDVQIAIDTEGSQIRTSDFGAGGIHFALNSTVKLHRYIGQCDQHNICITPADSIGSFKPGDLIELDFNSVVLRVEDISQLSDNGYIICRVVIEGHVDSRKGVHCDTIGINNPAFSRKDLVAIDLAKKHGIRHFTLSFMNSAAEVEGFRRLCPDSFVYAKIETRKGVMNCSSILDVADGILIDRGDLSREIPIEKIPFAQKTLIALARSKNKEVLVASNLLETMAASLKPTRAEANDVISTILDGVSGFVLTKETAVGRYPVETVNMLGNLIYQAGMIRSLSGGRCGAPAGGRGSLCENELDFIINGENGYLISAHGGKLVDRGHEGDAYLEGSKRLPVGDDVLMDLDAIGTGGFSPIEGFMKESDYRSVLNDMRLKSGVPWTIPIILTVSASEREMLKGEQSVLITSRDSGEAYGVLEIEDIYPFDKDEYAMKIYSTADGSHPGVQGLISMGEFNVGGKVKMLRRYETKYSHLSMTPKQTRKLFESMGWSRVIGFHTRNVIHRSHEYLQLEAMERCGCDGLFVHPVIGKKKRGDYSAEMIIESYQVMMDKYYPRNKVVLAAFLTYSRYAGPREAIFTALCRKNYGCSHFIVGRDHTGVGNFYPEKASQEIFNEFDDLGIEPVFFDTIGYSKKLSRYVSGGDIVLDDLLHISGTEARRMLSERKKPADWFMRPQISDLIINKITKGEEVFVK